MINGETKIVDIKKVKPNKWNPNKQSDFIYEREVKSIQENGQIDPILVREKKKGEYEIIDGEHRWRAMTDLKEKKIEIKNLGKVTDVTAKKLTVLMNELRGEANQEKMQAIIQELAQEINFEELYASLPMTQNELQGYIDGIAMNVDELAQDIEDNAKAQGLAKDGFTLVTFEVTKKIAKQFKDLVEELKSETQPDTPAPEANLTPVFELIIKVFKEREKSKKAA